VKLLNEVPEGLRRLVLFFGSLRFFDFAAAGIVVARCGDQGASRHDARSTRDAGSRARVSSDEDRLAGYVDGGD
jgi:hypothetical protein